MTKVEYAAYVRSVQGFMERENINCLSIAKDQAESYFSWRPCDCCGKRLGGNREDMIGYNPDTKEVQGPYRVCEDCIYFSEYGELDDQTMLDMEDK